jgi:hypothetical protein
MFVPAIRCRMRVKQPDQDFDWNDFGTGGDSEKRHEPIHNEVASFRCTQMPYCARFTATKWSAPVPTLNASSGTAPAKHSSPTS